MTINNKYIKSANISRAKFHELLKLFSTDLDTPQIAEVKGTSRNTLNRYLKYNCEINAAFCEKESSFSGSMELNGTKRVKDKRGRGAYGKTIFLAYSSVTAIFNTKIV